MHFFKINHTHTTGRANRLRPQLGQQHLFGVLRHGGNNVHQARLRLQAVLGRQTRLHLVQVDVLALFVRLDQLLDDLADDLQHALLARQADACGTQRPNK